MIPLPRLMKRVMVLPVKQRSVRQSLLIRQQNPIKVPIRQLHNQIFQRLNDKPYRSIFREATRKVELYNSSKVKLQPTIQNYLVELELLRKASAFDVKLELPTKYHNEIFFEPIIYGILSSLITPDMILEYTRTMTVDNSIDEQKISSIETMMTKSRFQKVEMLNMIYERITFEKYPSRVTASQMINDLKVHDEEMFQIAMACLTKISPNHALIPWIRSLTSFSITEACKSLSYLTDIPGIIVSDILLRTPRSRDELDLQLDLWYQFSENVIRQNHKSSKIKLIFESMLKSCSRYCLFKVPDFLKNSVEVINQHKLGFDVVVSKNAVTAFQIDNNDEYLNNLIWDLSFNHIEPRLIVYNSTSHIISAQHFLVNKLSKNDGRPQLSFKGRLGIILSLSIKYKSKARELLNVAEQTNKFKKLQYQDNQLKNQYNFVKLMVSTNYEELLEGFNNSNKTSLVWLGFIKKLEEFELMNSTRAMKILSMISNSTTNNDHLLTQSIMDHLFIYFRSTSKMKLACNILNSKRLLHYFIPFLKLEYMMILYSKLNEPINDDILKSLLPTVDKSHDTISMARMLFHSSPFKSMYYVGKMLRGESRIRPQTIYELYQQQVIERDLLPNEDCIVALIKSSMILNEDNEPYLWQDSLYAPQIVINEVKNYVSIHKPYDGPITFTDQAWRSYIVMLKQFEYIPELAEIIRYWQSTKFVPHPDTLKCLLMALPLEYSQRYIRHAEKIKHDTKTEINDHRSIINWPWPSFHQLTNHR